jgi:hypothetical protein
MENNQIIIYQSQDGKTSIEVKLEGETVWLSLNQIAGLFSRDKSVVSRHISNIFKEKELDKSSVVAKNATTGSDGKTYQVEYYNLDVIISVGYRVKSQSGTQFRLWANKILKDYLTKGYAIDAKRFQEQSRQLEDLKQAVKILGNVIANKKLNKKKQPIFFTSLSRTIHSRMGTNASQRFSLCGSWKGTIFFTGRMVQSG